MDVLGERSFKTATCKLVSSIALPVRMRPMVRELTMLYVPHDDRKKGYGSQLLHDVCREVDSQNLTLLLQVEESDKERLCAWYTRFGFQPIQAKPILMARVPGSAPMAASPISSAIRKTH